MKNLENYLHFCRKFHNLNLPKLKFKILNERYSYLYRKLYDIDEDDINKASFIINLSSFSISVILSIVLLEFNLLIILLYSAILSFILSYRFNLILYHEINRKESIINASLYLIKIDFSLIQKTLKSNSDYCLNFIKLIIEYKHPFLGNFKDILTRIHEGSLPEVELTKLITPSEDFNQYLKNLLINNFDNNKIFNDYKDSALEKKFKIYLRGIQSKISILFFIGIFFPIGLCFLILFRLINLLILIFVIPFFLYFLHILFRKFLKKDSYMVGVLREYSSLEKRRFNEFLLFLKSFAINLKNNISPERAFLKSYKQNKNIFKLLEQPVKNQLYHLLNFNYTFKDMIHFLKLELKSIKYSMILDAIEKFVVENANYSSEKIFDILEVIHKHQGLEKKLEVIIKGEKFKIFFFIFLLPILIGAISGMFPFFILITRNINSSNYILLIDFHNLINIYYIIVINFIFISSISITSYYFLKIINYQKKFLIIFISDLVFILTFISSFLNALSFI